MGIRAAEAEALRYKAVGKQRKAFGVVLQE